MRLIKPVLYLAIVVLATIPMYPVADTTARLTVSVDNVNDTGGNIGVFLFRDSKGWPESKEKAFRWLVVPAHPGVVVVEVADLPPGRYAVAVGHDSNVNHRVDKNWFGKPTEQWGMSNNPHANLKAPDFSKAVFELTTNKEIRVHLQ